jgi:hypothetical protein
MALAGLAGAANERLYTAPDPASPGGLKGHIARPAQPVGSVVAVPRDEPGKAYDGTLGGDGREFRFEGLPMGKYDLLVIYEDAFFEGLQLSREPNTLTRDDLRKIDDTVNKSEPFFTQKTVHRVEGTSGRGGAAHALCAFLRDKSSMDGAGATRQEYRRAIKLLFLQDVGVGWQIVQSRDLYPAYVKPANARPVHHFAEALGGIRVTDHVKDMGDIDLTAR